MRLSQSKICWNQATVKANHQAIFSTTDPERCWNKQPTSVEQLFIPLTRAAKQEEATNKTKWGIHSQKSVGADEPAKPPTHRNIFDDRRQTRAKQTTNQSWSVTY